MRTWTIAAATAVTSLLTFGVPRAQAQATLTPQDYVAIQQLVASYPYALDTGADQGRMYAELFTDDGEFVSPQGTIRGRSKLAEFAFGHRPGQGPLLARNFGANLWIEPSGDGARGKQYGVVIDFAENGQPSSIVTGGHFEDVYVKTADGWRIKRREFVPSKVGPSSPR